jgi:hypothetical protein
LNSADVPWSSTATTSSLRAALDTDDNDDIELE